MRLMLRVDDIGWRPHNEIDSKLVLARAFHAILDDRPYLAGVIPGILDADGLAWIRSKPSGMTVALHGWKHETGMDGGGCEFEGMGTALCNYLLERGLSLIGPVSDFIPPQNATTPELLGACRRQGLRVWGQPCTSETPLPPEEKDFGTFISAWVPLYGATKWRIAEDRPAILDVLSGMVEHDGAAIVTIHLTWEAGLSRSLDGVRQFADQYGDRLITPDQYLESFE